MNEKIEEAITLLEQEVQKSENPPAMVIMAPDMAESIRGNRGGFLQLAITAIRASEGQNQNLDMQPWVCHEDVDWQINGLSFDEHAHLYLPERPSKWKVRRQNWIGYIVLLMIVGCFVVGFGTIVHWILR